MPIGFPKIIGLIIVAGVVVLFVLINNQPIKDNQSTDMNNSRNTHMKFECSTLRGLTFDFPIFAHWDYQGIETGQLGYCTINLRLPLGANISSDSPNVVKILVFKTSNPSSLIGQVRLRGINKNNIEYTIYDNNELRFKKNDETISIIIQDTYTFGGVDTGSMAISLPTKENGFDYEEFWEQILESLKYDPAH